MTLVYNLVTQQDSSIMIQDSSSMKGIAILTLVFLPGAFTSVRIATSSYMMIPCPALIEVAVSPQLWHPNSNKPCPCGYKGSLVVLACHYCSVDYRYDRRVPSLVPYEAEWIVLERLISAW
jgi:hypothetical protein